MKLRNKKTGEIVPLSIYGIQVNSRTEEQPMYHSIAELTDEWEDYEEPKGYWCIDWDGGINHIDLLGNPEGEHEEKKKQIGNYFETAEEAEKAVEKLKAWKRLKEAGFVFEGYDGRNIKYNVYRKNSEDIMPDLDLLFGGENE